jgi:glyoxalase family protein
MEGVKGVGQVTQVAFAVPPGSLKFWSKRLQRLQVEQFHSTEIFGKPAVEFQDPDDLGLLLIEETESDLSFHSPHSVWITDQVGAEVAIQHFYSATLAAESMELLQPLLENGLGYHFQTAQQQLHRFTLSGQHKAADLIIEKAPDLEPGFGGAGTVHHIAFRVRDQQHQLALRSLMSDYGLHPTQVIDRFYFHSVYFRTPAGILFELATDAPGFTVDEPVETLGEKLSLPPFLESYRSTIEAGLTPLK